MFLSMYVQSFMKIHKILSCVVNGTKLDIQILQKCLGHNTLGGSTVQVLDAVSRDSDVPTEACRTESKLVCQLIFRSMEDNLYNNYV